MLIPVQSCRRTGTGSGRNAQGRKPGTPRKHFSPVSRNDMIMPAYYFAVEGTKNGDTTDPATDNLITIQYQKIDLPTGEILEPLTILRSWKSSEKEIVTQFYNEFFRPGTPVTHFIPVGLNLDYAYELLNSRFKKHNLPAVTSHELWYLRPRFDLRPIVILLNDGRFTGASLNAFSLKQGDTRHMEKWVDKGDYDRIEHYIREEAGRFLKVLQYLSKYKSRLGITRKDAPAPGKAPQELPAERPAPKVHASPRPPVQTGGKRVADSPEDSRSRPAAVPSSSPRSEKPAGSFVKKVAGDRARSPRDRPAPAASKGPRPLLKSPERTPAERKKSPAARNQLGKHPSAKSAPGRETPARKGPAKRR
jgi:hypothetical protein